LGNSSGKLGYMTDYNSFFNNYTIQFPASYCDDVHNNTATCNAMTAEGAVASSSEHYRSTSRSLRSSRTQTVVSASGPVCSGIIDSVYAPPTGLNAFPASGLLGVNPFSSPYIYQNASERAIATLLDAVPIWLSKQCYTALRNILCASLLMAPQTVNLHKALGNGSSMVRLSIGLADSHREINLTTVLTRLLNSIPADLEISVPRYPSRQVCLEFRHQCSGDLSQLWWEGVESYLVADCDQNATSTATAVGGSIATYLYPTAKQVVLEVPIVLPDTNYSGRIAVQILSAPSTAGLIDSGSSSEEDASPWPWSSWTPVCPHYFVVPDDKNDKRNWWISGSGCAHRCR
jgi:hypothetical protein